MTPGRVHHTRYTHRYYTQGAIVNSEYCSINVVLHRWSTTQHYINVYFSIVCHPCQENIALTLASWPVYSPLYLDGTDKIYKASANISRKKSKFCSAAEVCNDQKSDCSQQSSCVQHSFSKVLCNIFIYTLSYTASAKCNIFPAMSLSEATIY